VTKSTLIPGTSPPNLQDERRPILLTTHGRRQPNGSTSSDVPDVAKGAVSRKAERRERLIIQMGGVLVSRNAIFRYCAVIKLSESKRWRAYCNVVRAAHKNCAGSSQKRPTVGALGVTFRFSIVLQRDSLWVIGTCGPLTPGRRSKSDWHQGAGCLTQAPASRDARLAADTQSSAGQQSNQRPMFVGRANIVSPRYRVTAPPTAPRPPPTIAPVAGLPPVTAETPAPAPAPNRPPVTARVPVLLPQPASPTDALTSKTKAANRIEFLP